MPELFFTITMQAKSSKAAA